MTQSRPPLADNPLPGVPLIESPLFSDLLPQMDLAPDEQELARQIHEHGFALMDFPDPDLDARIERIKADLAPLYSVDMADPSAIKTIGDQRLQDAWRYNDDVRALAANPSVLSLLGRLYGRRAFPFQTLNFPVGTQQALHSDSAHFSSQPERFMCGVWVALEDIGPDAGPLRYCPGSHRWPVITNAMIGRRGWESETHSAQAPFEAAWQGQVAASGAATQTLLARRGQALIWAANLLHGGSPQTDPRLTRWSQVTHYYFDDCIYYTPAFSDEPLGRLDLRAVTDIATGEFVPNSLNGEPVALRPGPSAKRPGGVWTRLFGRNVTAAEPEGWDAALYLQLNPDVAAAGEDPLVHYTRHGRLEGRRYWN